MAAILISPQAIYTGPLILVNGQHPYRLQEGKLPLLPIQQDSSIQLCAQAKLALQKLLQHIGAQQDIVAVSGWRSLAEQQQIWQQSLVDSGLEFTQQYVALPGCSEHQTGWAIDVGYRCGAIDFIRPAFPHSGICQTFREQAAAFGFIERYPKGKEPITGIAYEPWHFRYVGVPHAAILAERGFTLEEYTAYLRQYPYGERALVWQEAGRCYEISFLEITRPCTVHVPEHCQLSGNNVDGMMITVERSRRCG